MPTGKSFVLNLGAQQRHGYNISHSFPAVDLAYSPRLDMGFNRQYSTWYDEQPHLHTSSEEYFILLQGRLDLLINGEPFSVEPYQLLGIRANVPHQIVGVKTPITNFFLRIPGGSSDKVLLNKFDPSAHGQGCMQIDLRQPHDNYLLGASLPQTDPNYSSFFDFTCAWDADPAEEWKNEVMHFHTNREEFYMVMKGSLDFALDDSVITVSSNQVLAVRPNSVHNIVGGKGPVDVLFVRVPGGQGDKTVVASG